MTVLAIDPGYEQSAWVLFDGTRVVAHAIESNDDFYKRLRPTGLGTICIISEGKAWHPTAYVLEQIESFGMAVGKEVFETVFWTGRFFEAACANKDGGAGVHRMPRRAVKVHLCQSARAQDSNVRVALLDQFGGRERALGKKKTPGPLFGIKSHEWSALAIAVTFHDQHMLAQ